MKSFKIILLFLVLCSTHSSFGFLQSLFGPRGLLQMIGLGGRLPFGRATVNQSGLMEAPVCSKRACVNFTVISSNPAYEHRRYSGMTLAATTTSSSFSMPKTSMYRRLRRYIRGDNNENEKLNMTYPILTPIDVTAANDSMMFILPTSLPPTPINNLVQITYLPQMEVYARRFRGNSFSSNDSQTEMAAFRTSLGTFSRAFAHEAFIAEFNSPFSIFNRYAEMWLVAKDVSRVDQEVLVPAVDEIYQSENQFVF